jgi:plasmid stability protein
VGAEKKLRPETEDPMAQLLVRNLEDDVKVRLQLRARRHGRSTEEEVREILRNAVSDESSAKGPLGSRLRARFAGIGLDDDLPELRGEVASQRVIGLWCASSASTA